MSPCKSTSQEAWTVGPEIRAAHERLRENAKRAIADTTRPRFHFLPPSGWMNDPNGTVYHDGYYHLFYQHNPYSDVWHNLHWGHARSRDLVNWEHLPIALVPDRDLGEASIYSGSCVIRDGQPMLFYTKVGIKPEEKPREQCAAVSSDDMITWARHPNNPVISASNYAGPPVKQNWRDPFVFTVAGRYFLLLAAELTEATGGDYVVLLFEAVTDELDQWTYRSVLLRNPRYGFGFFECPNFVQLDGAWVLLTSPYKPVEYRVGTFDVDSFTFTPQTTGRLDAGIDYYATNVAHAPDGRTILFAWVRGFQKGRGWNGCLALPRELTLDANGHPISRPVEELKQLRGTPLSAENLVVVEKEVELAADVPLECAEIECSVEMGDASAVELSFLRSQDGQRKVTISYDRHWIDVDGTRVEYDGMNEITLQIFIDRTVLEVFVDGGRGSLTRVIYPDQQGSGVSVRTQSGSATLRKLQIWPIAPADIAPQHGISV